MNRGKLKVFLGAAPGVGKTYAVLEEGHRLRDQGRDIATPGGGATMVISLKITEIAHSPSKAGVVVSSWLTHLAKPVPG
ncbi:MAG TPA: hypothetical protein VIW94_05745 [Acidimicrobiia bacterium]